MKSISPIKFILATFAFTWALSALSFSVVMNKDIPAMLLYILGGVVPSFFATFFVWRAFNKEHRVIFGHVLLTRKNQTCLVGCISGRYPGSYGIGCLVECTPV